MIKLKNATAPLYTALNSEPEYVILNRMRAEKAEEHTTAADVATDVWCVIPVYNNADTIRSVAERVLAYHSQLLVIDDGSTDCNLSTLLDGLGCVVLRHARNQGKGAAILTAAREVACRGGHWMVTLDGDGQHDPADLPAFFKVLEAAGNDDAFVVIGVRDMSAPHIPKSSRFGRAFSDGWVRLETGVKVHDSQSGFRAYPVHHLNRLRLQARRFDFEIEALVRLLWGGLEVLSVPVGVWYPQPGERRVTHFRPVLDNLRLSLLHARLVARRLLPWPHRKLVSPRRNRPVIESAALNPATFFRELLAARSSPFELAASAAIGVFFGTLPLVATHSVVIAYVGLRLRLNLLVALSIQSLCAPPVVPVACVLLGYRLRTGGWMNDLSWAKIPSEYLARLGDWLIGSLVLAPVLAALAAAGVYAVAATRRRRRDRPRPPRQRGNAFGLAWFRMLVRLGGLRAAYAMLYPVCLYYALFDRPAVRSILPYVRHRFPERSRFGKRLAVYRIFLEQGRMLVDRHAALARPSLVDFSIRDEAKEELKRLADEGGILLMSHVGNWQAVIPTLANLGKTVHLVMAAETNAAVSKTLRLDDSSGAIRIINAERFLDAAPRIVAALDAGEIVSLMGDRAYGAASAPVQFLGGTAHFPVAAFRIAAATGKPVCFLFAGRVGRGRYVVEVPAVHPPSGRLGIGRGLESYAAALGAFSDAHPFQCFPFADLWA